VTALLGAVVAVPFTDVVRPVVTREIPRDPVLLEVELVAETGERGKAILKP